MSEMIERVARAICSEMGCLRKQLGIIEDRCVHADGSNAPCGATVDQLILSPQWAAAQAAIAETIEAMREPTTEK